MLSKFKKHKWKLILLIPIIIMALFQIEADRINEKFLAGMEYSEWHRRAEEFGPEYNIVIYPMQGHDLDDKLRVKIIFPKREYKGGFDINISLVLYIERWGNNKYLFAYGEYLPVINNDTVYRDFGGNVWVDKDMNFVPEYDFETEMDEETAEIMREYKDVIQQIVDIANERWELGMSCSGIE